MKNAAEEKSPGTASSHGSRPFSPLDADAPARKAPPQHEARSLGLHPHPRPRRVEHSLGVVPRGISLDHRRRAVCPKPASSRHDFTCALATGISYSMPLSAAPRTSSGGSLSSRAEISAPIWRSGLRDPVDRPAADRLVSVQASRSAPGCPASQPGQEPHQGPRVADVDRDRLARLGLCRAVQPDALELDVERSVRSLGLRSTPAPSAATAARVERVSAESRKPEIVRGPARHRREEGGAVGDRLVRGRRERAFERAGWRERSVLTRWTRRRWPSGPARA